MHTLLARNSIHFSSVYINSHGFAFFLPEVKYLYQPIKVNLNEEKLEVLIVHKDFMFPKSNIY